MAEIGEYTVGKPYEPSPIEGPPPDEVPLEEQYEIEFKNWRRSKNIGQLVKALCAAKLEFGVLKKERVNPFFKSKYADLEAGIDASRTALAKHDISIVQLPLFDGERAGVTTLIAHSSDQFISCDLTLKMIRDDPQGNGGNFTFARRYAREAMLDMSGENDDDANYATTGKSGVGPRPPSEAVKTTDKEAPKASPKPRTWAQQFWATADANKKTREQVRDYLKNLGCQSTTQIPEDKQAEAMKWAQSDDTPLPSEP